MDQNQPKPFWRKELDYRKNIDKISGMKLNQVETNTETCLVCDSSRLKRGLCSKHYQEFLRRKDSLPEEQQDLWEKRLIEKNQLLPPKPGNRSNTNAFDEEFEAFKKQLDKAVAKHEIKEAVTKPAKPGMKKKGTK